MAGPAGRNIGRLTYVATRVSLAPGFRRPGPLGTMVG